MYGIAVMSKFGEWLKTEIAAREWTQSYAAERMGIPLQTLNDIINKPKKDPSPSTLRKIADGLSVSLEQLFERLGYESSNAAPTAGRTLPESVRGLSEETYKLLSQMESDELERYLSVLADRRRRSAGQ
jgi:transcriptional regulator with XRE-family HTH domain